MEALDSRSPRMLRYHRSVESPYRRAQNQIGRDTRFIERFEHPHFDGTPLSPSSEDVSRVDLWRGHARTLVAERDRKSRRGPDQDWSSSMYHSVKSVHRSSSPNLITNRLR